MRKRDSNRIILGFTFQDVAREFAEKNRDQLARTPKHIKIKELFH